MTKINEVLKGLTQIEPKGRPKKPVFPLKVSKKELAKYVKQNKSTKAIAFRFKVSERTVYRRIREYDLKGVRPVGRKPLVEKPKFVKPKEEWIDAERYVDRLNREYRFVNIQYPPFRYINPETLVCSNEKANPKGKFTTVGIYYIALVSNVYFLFPISVRYNSKAIPFKQIYEWAKENAFDVVLENTRGLSITVERVVALTFTNPQKKPRQIGGV